jgi:hypothetical protein
MCHQLSVMQHVDRKDGKVPIFFACQDLCGGYWETTISTVASFPSCGSFDIPDRPISHL